MVGLQAAAFVGVGVNDGGAGARAGDALGDDRLNRIGSARLKLRLHGPFSALRSRACA
jgi:hypothetical protein